MGSREPNRRQRDDAGPPSVHRRARARTSSAALLRQLYAFIPADRRHALARGEAMADRVSGAALFADISGFTPLTEVLAGELGPQRGAEELTRHLNRVFHELISQLDRFGGHVIYFSGDAITCWFDRDEGEWATACALAMQDVMRGSRHIETPSGTQVELAMKVAIAVGAARRFVVGDPEVQLIDVLAGGVIDALATAEHHARRGEVVLDQSALDSLGERVSVSDVRTDEGTGRRCAPVLALSPGVLAHAPKETEEDLSEEIARRWVLPALYERLRSGRGEFLAELRPAFPVFARFEGIEYDNDDAPPKLDAFVRQVQRIFSLYEGSLVHLSVGDKGAYFFGVFGSPRAHEDDAARAAAAALELRELPGVTAVTGLQIGITHGRLRSGMYGHAQRQAFTCLGDAVNLAARLMSHAPRGEIYATAAVHDATRDLFVWNELAPIHVKGKRDAVHAWRLASSLKHSPGFRPTFESPMIGRTAELATLMSKLDQATRGKGSAIGITSEAGMGKSRLIGEFTRGVAERCIAMAIGECQAFGSNTRYVVWRDIWRSLFGLDESLPDAQKITRVEAELAAIAPALVHRSPLLAAMLELPIPDNELTAGFDAKLRKSSLEALLTDCLRARARRAPLVIVLEDCHWIDSLSRDLLQVLARALPELHCLLLVAYRPVNQAADGPGLKSIPHLHEIELADLDSTQAATLIAVKLQQRFGQHAEVPPGLVQLVTARAQGNPFYIEELLNYIGSKNVDVTDAAALKKLDLPHSLHSLILSRIDDLAEAPRRALKVASVIGRAFRASMLRGVYPELGAMSGIRKDLAELEATDLVLAEVQVEESYIFRHALTQEVAYESMPTAFRSGLHERVARYMERTEPMDRHLDLLAHHYGYSDNIPKKREYFGRAGDAAQASYANAAAIDYFERLAPLLDGRERADVLLKLGKVLELSGKWQHAQKVDSQALALATAIGDGRCRASGETALAEVARKQGRLDEASERLNRAARDFETSNDETGLGRVHHLLGTVALQRGEYDKAVRSYEASLAIRERLDDKPSMGSVYSNLGVIAEYRGDYPKSRQFHERAMALREAAGDRWGIGVSMQNLGQIAVLQKRFGEARDWFERTVLIAREVGDNWMSAICQHNLGNATRGLGDYDAARKHYGDCVRTYRDYNDQFNLAFALEDIALLAAAAGDAVSAHDLVRAADALRTDIGMPRAPALEQDLYEQLAHAEGLLSDEERASLHQRSSLISLPVAIERALSLCEAAPGTAPARVAMGGAGLDVVPGAA